MRFARHVRPALLPGLGQIYKGDPAGFPAVYGNGGAGFGCDCLRGTYFSAGVPILDLSIFFFFEEERP